jgi:hypothetical protein
LPKTRANTASRSRSAPRAERPRRPHDVVLRDAIAAIAQLRKDNLLLAWQCRRLKAAVSKDLSLSVKSPTFDGGLGGRTAIEHYRNTNVAAFLEHLNEAGTRAIALGEPTARFFLGTAVLADLQTVYAVAPKTEEEARRRHLAEWELKNPSTLAVLSGTGPEGEEARLALMKLFLSSGVDASVHELVRRSPEQIAGKTVREDDDDSAP